MNLRWCLWLTLAVLVGTTPVFGETAKSDEKLTLKIVLHEEDIAYSDRLAEEILQKLLDVTGSDLVLTRNEKRFFEIYFDTPERTFLQKNGFIFYQAEEYLTKKKKKRKYHELVFYNSGSNETLQFEVRHYNKMQSAVGKHPLFSLVKRNQRPELLAALNQAGVKYPLRLKSIFEVAKNRNSFVLFEGDQKLLAIQSSFLTGMQSRSEASFGLVTVDIDQEILKRLGAVQQDFVRDFLAQLEKIGVRVAPEENDYKIIFRQMEKKVMFFTLLLRYPGLANFLYAVAIGSVGVLLIMLFVRKKGI